MTLLLILMISSLVMISSFVIGPSSNINILKATNTNRDDLSDRDFKEIFRLSKTADVSKPPTKAKSTPGKRWGEVLGPEYLYTPLSIDSVAVGWTIATQTLLINLSFLAGYLLDQRMTTLTNLSFDLNSVSLGACFGLGMALLGAIADTLPIFKDITRDTRMFTLRLLGRDTSAISALGTALLLSLGAGIAEEAFFRGVVFNVANWAIGVPGAFIVSSGLFALGHFPVWGANAINEAFLGGIFCFCYYYSGYNLAVPIIAHALYDLITIFTTWRSASTDMKKRMTVAIKEGTSDLDREMGSYTSTQIERAITKAIFDVLDLDGDGSIDAKELKVGMRLFGFGSPLFSTPGMAKKTDELFQAMDTNKDGKISFKEFSEALKREGAFSAAANVQAKKA